MPAVKAKLLKSKKSKQGNSWVSNRGGCGFGGQTQNVNVVNLK
jgi:hypothetical protein